jgi:hypothetical protein
MTETVICARCQQEFEREVVEVTTVREAHLSTFSYIEEPEPVCDGCEHEYLSWAGCPPLC